MSHTLKQYSVLFIALLQCSCMQSPREQLIGRWYNSTNSMRFTAAGHIRWNSTRGSAQGNYIYDADVHRSTENEPTHNLNLEILRTGQRLQPAYELQFLGANRIRLTPIISSASDRRGILILKRAEAGDQETLIPLAEPEETDLPGMTTVSG